MSSRRILRAVLGLSLALAATRAFALDVTTCHQTVPSGATGEVMADLDCATDLAAVRLEPGARLDLNGHTIRGGVSGVVSSGGGKYAIRGPGMIADALQYCAIIPQDNAVRSRLKIKDVTLRGCGLGGAAAGAKLDLVRVKIEDVPYTSEGFGNGAVGHDVRTRDCEISNTHVGIRGYDAVKAVNTIVRDGNVGIRVDEGRFTGRGVTVTGNESWGIRVGTPTSLVSTMRISRSTITGNLYDLASPTLPKLVATVCGTSAAPHSDGNFGPSWGVCQNDP